MVSEYVTLVCMTIIEMEHDYVKWPTPNEMAIEESTFYSRYGMSKTSMFNF